MDLSTDLISEFVKVTLAKDKGKRETTFYGTVVEEEGSMYVQLDGSNVLTPTSTTVGIRNGERVTVLLKNHTAIVTGNVSSPAARIVDVDALEESKANNASLEELANAHNELVDNVIDNFAALEEQMAAIPDSAATIASAGTSGIWTYKKWANGDVDLWGVYPVSNLECKTQLGVLYSTALVSPTSFPFEVTNPVVVSSYESDGYGAFLWPVSASTSTKPPTYYLVRPDTKTITSGKIAIRVSGKWEITV